MSIQCQSTNAVIPLCSHLSSRIPAMALRLCLGRLLRACPRVVVRPLICAILEPPARRGRLRTFCREIARASSSSPLMWRPCSAGTVVQTNIHPPKCRSRRNTQSPSLAHSGATSQTTIPTFDTTTDGTDGSPGQRTNGCGYAVARGPTVRLSSDDTPRSAPEYWRKELHLFRLTCFAAPFSASQNSTAL